MNAAMVTQIRRMLGLAPKRRRPSARPRDFQRARVYRWERVCVHSDTAPAMSLDECRALVEQVYVDRERPGRRRSWSPPTVTDGRGRRHAGGSREVIKLPRWSRRRTIVLHECAHGLSDDGHGPEFMRVYIDLLADFAGMDGDALLRSALQARLRVAD